MGRHLDLEKIYGLFAENFTLYGDLGASLSIWQDQKEVVRLGQGFEDRQQTRAWSAETRVLVWSATKSLSVGTVLACLEAEGITLDRRVADIWPEFAEAGKKEVTLAQLLSHQAGLAGVSGKAVSVFDHAAVVEALAHQEPLWPPGTRHGYHPRTFGFLLDELVRRLTRRTLGEMWRLLFAEPLQLDLWIGLPAELVETVAPVYPARNVGGLPDNAFWKAMADPNSLTRLAFTTPEGLGSVASMNTPPARLASLPALNGIGTASALGKWYALLATGGEWEGERYFQPETLASMSRSLASGFDSVTQEVSAFSAGMMLDPLDENGNKIRSLYGPSLRAFGHPGAGGSHAFADPENRIAFAYVMNQLELGIFPNAKSLRIVEAIYS